MAQHSQDNKMNKRSCYNNTRKQLDINEMDEHSIYKLDMMKIEALRSQNTIKASHQNNMNNLKMMQQRSHFSSAANFFLKGHHDTKRMYFLFEGDRFAKLPYTSDSNTTTPVPFLDKSSWKICYSATYELDRCIEWERKEATRVSNQLLRSRYRLGLDRVSWIRTLLSFRRHVTVSDGSNEITPFKEQQLTYS